MNDARGDSAAHRSGSVASPVRVIGATSARPVRENALAEAVVDLDAIAHNTELIARAAAPAAVMAVVKADAFGHGMVPVARTALAHGASWLGVATSAEALQLRAAGIGAPLLSWVHSPHEDFRPALLADVDLSVSSAEVLEAISCCAAELGVRATIHLKVDTGLSRGGAAEPDWPALVRRARWLERNSLVRVRGVWSHLISADDPGGGHTAEQVERFDAAVAAARAAGLDPELRHLANSAAALDAPRTHYDLVRPGIGLYGVEPVAGKVFGLRTALTLRARTILVKEVPAGTGVSYGHDYATARDGRLALVPLGYADGVPRQASGRGEVRIRGRRYPIAGRIAMDQFVVDLGQHAADVGAEVVVIGGDGPAVTEWARWAGTLPHEIYTGIGSRVARRYIGERTAHLSFGETCVA
ncbi:alanine racemase [Saccharopolyspora indica]|uniref:alanine racemase n=1 Tax=Saccharopolyspora indica TaxID=1229659 RepID=UPI0022EA88BB|nr:alanine racemase [Saccharopolyspora indica]MDA3645900.1 alanine racemase [Saccharopolyspora indica]